MTKSDFSNIENSKSVEIKISGSIGMNKLTDGKKNVFIFHDDHSNVKYCYGSNSNSNSNIDSNNLFLYDIMEYLIEFKTDWVILVEEPFLSDYANVKFLWNDTPHIVGFRNFYKKITKKCSKEKKCFVFPIDIRLILTDVSFDELILNIESDIYFKDYNPKVKEYFRYIGYLFDVFENLEKSHIEYKDYSSNFLFIKKIFDLDKKNKCYLNLKKKFKYIYLKYIANNLDISIQDFILKRMEYNNKSDDFMTQYDKFINGVMEFYACILIEGLGQKNVIIHSGHYHSKKILYLLEKYYNYKNIYSIGHTENFNSNDRDNNYVNNCLYLDKNIFFTI